MLLVSLEASQTASVCNICTEGRQCCRVTAPPEKRTTIRKCSSRCLHLWYCSHCTHVARKYCALARCVRSWCSGILPRTLPECRCPSQVCTCFRIAPFSVVFNTQTQNAGHAASALAQVLACSHHHHNTCRKPWAFVVSELHYSIRNIPNCLGQHRQMIRPVSLSLVHICYHIMPTHSH